MKPKDDVLMRLFLLCAFPTIISCEESFPPEGNSLFKLCTEELPKQCQQISRDQQVECLQVTSKVDCLLNADRGLPHFGLISPEQALLGAPLVSDNVVVIGELVPEHAPYQTAVIVRRSFVGGLSNLKGLRYCHPGFKHNELVSKYVLEELESKVISVNCADNGNNATLLEKKIKALAEFFGTSCRPGKWSEDQELDAKLKNQYSSLCDNCGIQKCNVNYVAPFNDTLLECLSSYGGDVAVTSLRDAEAFFSTDANTQNYQYLCSDGKLSDPSTPCTWTNQMKWLFITSRDAAEQAQNYIRTTLKTHLIISDDITPYSVDLDTVEASLASILSLERRRINITDATPLKAYVEARRTIPSVNDSKLCNLTVNWSTTGTEEQQKCKWLQQASVNAGFQPIIECIQSLEGDQTSSLNSIRDGRADIAFTPANYGYLALKKGLTNIAYPETDIQQLSKIVIVVRANTTNTFSNIVDLKSKSACFPEYGGKEWLAFVDAIRTAQNNKSCDYGKIFTEFIGQSCVPVSNTDDYKISITDDKLCGNCIPINNSLPAKYCSADDGNKYYSTNGALRCLLDGTGEFAVISINDVTRTDILESQLLVLSANGSLAKYTGLNVDENAALSVITAGEVVIAHDNPKFNDTVLLLRDIEVEFGQSINKPFEVFESFNGTSDLLFPDSTPGLTFGGTRIKYVENFQRLIRTSEQCVIEQSTSNAYSAVPNSFVMMCLISSLFFTFQ